MRTDEEAYQIAKTNVDAAPPLRLLALKEKGLPIASLISLNS
jgi:hypothetical protein